MNEEQTTLQVDAEVAALQAELARARADAAEREDGSVPAGHVAEVVQEGYLLGEAVLRPAQVVVARKPTIRVQRAPAQPARSPAAGGRRPDTIDPFENWLLGGKRWPRY